MAHRVAGHGDEDNVCAHCLVHQLGTADGERAGGGARARAAPALLVAGTPRREHVVEANARGGVARAAPGRLLRRHAQAGVGLEAEGGMQNTDRTRVPSPQSAVQLVQGLAYQPYSWQGSALHFWEADGGSSAQHVPPPVNSCGTCCLVATSRQCT